MGVLAAGLGADGPNPEGLGEAKLLEVLAVDAQGHVVHLEALVLVLLAPALRMAPGEAAPALGPGAPFAPDVNGNRKLLTFGN